MLLALWACATDAPVAAADLPPATPDEALAEITERLHRVAELAELEPSRAEAVLGGARVRFETSLEPALRERRDPLDVAATEYAFARVQHALTARKGAAAEVDVLLLKLRPARVALASPE